MTKIVARDGASSGMPLTAGYRAKLSRNAAAKYEAAPLQPL